jgi:hypothetical protein
LVVFLGDGGEEEVFQRPVGFGAGIGTSGRSGRRESGREVNVFSYSNKRGKMTIEFLDGKCVMVVSKHGTKLTLADGREFMLDGQTPLWLRCKSDGTVVELDELPTGFADFIESPPPDHVWMSDAKSYPDVFRK